MHACVKQNFERRRASIKMTTEVGRCTKFEFEFSLLEVRQRERASRQAESRGDEVEIGRL